MCGSIVEYLSLFALCTLVALCNVLLLDLCIVSSVSLRRHAGSFVESYQLTQEVALSPTSSIFQNIQIRHSYTLLGNLRHNSFDESVVYIHVECFSTLSILSYVCLTYVLTEKSDMRDK